jgi:hypothetical protein
MHPRPDGKGAGINAREPEKPMFFKKCPDRRQGSWLFTDLPGDAPKSADVGVLEVLRVNPVVPDEGEGEHQDLPEITGVGEGFHVAGHLGIEHQFAGDFTFDPKSLPDNRLTILKTQNRLHDFHMVCAGIVINDSVNAVTALTVVEWQGFFYFGSGNNVAGNIFPIFYSCFYSTTTVGKRHMNKKMKR